MDDIGNLVYILVFIVWFLSRIFGKKGKKTKPQSSPAEQQGSESSYPDRRGPTESTTPPVTFEDILRELTGAPSAPKSPEPQVEEEFETYYTDDIPNSGEETSFEVFEPELEIPTPAPTYKILKLKEIKSKRQGSSKAALQAVKMLRSKQGARQAFLMKEIFDRKY
jgi:hypothetical protein